MPYVLTTQSQVEWLYEEFPLLRERQSRHVGYAYAAPPNERVLAQLELRAGRRPPYQNHYEPEILPLPNDMNVPDGSPEFWGSTS
jgi:hypothetical protein